MTGRESRCPLCGVSGDAILTRHDVPLQIGVTWPTAATARAARTGNLVLVRCPICGLTWNAAPTTLSAEFAPGYDVSLHHSPTYRGYLEQEAHVLASYVDIKGRDVLEVGCGPGFFLRLLVEHGARRGVGFDPALAEDRVDVADGRGVELIAESFRPNAVTGHFAAIVCRSVLELVDNPLGLLRDMRRTAVVSDACPLYLEVPNADWIFGTARTWNLHFEHRWYFDATALRRCAEWAGLSVVSCEPCYDDGQYLRMIAAPRSAPDAEPVESGAGRRATTGLVAAFGREMDSWRERLLAWHADGRTVVMWGAGGRGTSFLNAVCGAGDVDLIACAVDINPDRQRRYIPGTGHVVAGPDELGTFAPSVVIVSNPTYEAEIRSNLAILGVSAEVVTL